MKNTIDLLEKVHKLPNFKGIPTGLWILGVRKSVNEFKDEFKDEIHAFIGNKHILTTTGTTHTGLYGLKNFKLWNSKGTAILKSNYWHYDIWKEGLHKGKMRAFTQSKSTYYYRDNDQDNNVEEYDNAYFGNAGLNFHTVSYNKVKNFILKAIGQWSVGCVVCNNLDDYYKIIESKPKEQTNVSLCIIKE